MLCATNAFCKAQTRLQTLLDNANVLVTSGTTVDRIDVAAYAEALQQLENTLSDMTAAGLGKGSSVGTAAKKLVCNLNVCAYNVCVLYFSFSRTHIDAVL